MNIRSFREGDEASLFAVFFSAVHQIALCDYTREQIDAWAPADMDTTAWGERMRSIRPFVVEIGDGSNASEVVGYGDVQPDGHITHFFVSGAHPRQGIGDCRTRFSRIRDSQSSNAVGRYGAASRCTTR